MPITKITLENYKGIRDRTEVANLEPGFKSPATPFNHHRLIYAKTQAQNSAHPTNFKRKFSAD